MALAARADRSTVLAVAWFPGRPAEVAHARDFVRGVLGSNCPALDDVLLMVSEIAGNAVRHTRSAGNGGGFDLTVLASGGTIRVAVGDQGSRTWPRLLGSSDTGAGTNGRGLRIVDALADEWGYIGEETGRVVWFEMTRRNGK